MGWPARKPIRWHSSTVIDADHAVLRLAWQGADRRFFGRPPIPTSPAPDNTLATDQGASDSALGSSDVTLPASVRTGQLGPGVPRRAATFRNQGGLPQSWNALPPSYQKMVEVSCNEANMWLMAIAEAKQGEAVAFHQKQGVEVHEWPPEFIDAFRQAWDEVAQEEAAADPRFKRV
jgi:Bacterial extracellular solute-binding protein, family 7